MQIKELVLTNFCGVAGTKTYTPQNINPLLGGNGTGKTTLLNGIRYALTGNEPDGPILHDGAGTCEVSIILTDPVTGEDIKFSRIRPTGKPSKFKIDDAATTLKAMNEKLETVIGIPLEKIAVTSSSELVAAMKPQEFSSFILDYIPKKITLEEVIKFVPDSTIEMIEVMEGNLPEKDISMETLDNFEKLCKTSRADIKDALAKKKALQASCPQEDPKCGSLEELKLELQEINNYTGKKALYVQQLSHYNKALETRNKYESSIAELKERIAANKAERPNPAVLASLNEEKASLTESISNQKLAIAGVYNAIQQLKVTLDALEKPICPVSPLITCHQDKTVAKEDIAESITSSEEGLAALNMELVKTANKLEKVEEKLTEYNTNAQAYTEKISLAKQLKALEEALPEIPARPKAIEEIDVSVKEKEIKAKLSLQEKYNEGLLLAGQIETLTETLAMYEKLCKTFAEKGPVRTGIITSYLKVFEDICNERSSKFRPNITFNFISEDGVVVLMSNGKCDSSGKPQMLPYKALSGGEKAYMLFILMDMLNQLTGTRLLFLDEMNIMDKETLEALLDIVIDAKAEYDHIYLASVNHADIVDVFKSKGL